MKPLIVVAGLLLGASAGAATPSDYASKWTLATDKAGAYSIMLDEGIYRQVTRADLSDLAAFNADGEELNADGLGRGKADDAPSLPGGAYEAEPQPASRFISKGFSRGAAPDNLVFLPFGKRPGEVMIDHPRAASVCPSCGDQSVFSGVCDTCGVVVEQNATS